MVIRGSYTFEIIFSKDMKKYNENDKRRIPSYLLNIF